MRSESSDELLHHSAAESLRPDHGARFRHLTSADVEPVQALLHRIWISAYGDILGAKGAEAYSQWVHCTSTMRHWSRPLRRHAALVAEVGEQQIVGFAGASMSFSGILTIHEVYIDEEWQGKGIGTKLIAACTAKYPGAVRHEIEVLASNPRAAALYRRLGFEPVGTRSDILYPQQVVLKLGRNPQVGCRYGPFDRIRIQLFRDA